MTGSIALLPITAGTLFHNKYQPSEKIGEGNFGEVWIAIDRAVNHTYAIKLLKHGVVVANQLREAQIGHAFEHNNLVRVHQADVTTDGRVIIVMEYLADGSITRLANPANFLILPIAMRTIIDVLQGLEHLHTSNCFHNDIKPENILRGPQGQAKLGDYGIVGVSHDGSPVPPPDQYVLHAAPETAAGNGIEARTDIFQTGLTLFRLLVGLGSLRAKLNSIGTLEYKAALATGKLITDNDFLPHIPRAVVRIINKSIHQDPNQRYQSALEMRRALEKLKFPGHWTVGPSGEFIGQDDKHQYRFTTIFAGNRSSIEACKKNLKSGRETRVSAYTKTNMSLSEARKLESAFIKAVVEGELR